MKPPARFMGLMNEITELASRIHDLTTYTTASAKTMSPAEAKLIAAQADAMLKYSEALAGRLFLITGKPT